MNVKPKTPASSRFWSKVDRSGECWLWTAATAGPMRYGVIGETRDHMVYAHRLSWEMANGPIPDGLFVLHRCDTPLCVRPEHLFLGTHQDNMDDARAKGRYPTSNPKLRGELNPIAKLTVERVRAIRSSSLTNVELGRRFGVSGNLIGQIRSRKAWAWLDAEVAA